MCSDKICHKVQGNVDCVCILIQGVSWLTGNYEETIWFFCCVFSAVFSAFQRERERGGLCTYVCYLELRNRFIELIGICLLQQMSFPSALKYS